MKTWDKTDWIRASGAQIGGDLKALAGCTGFFTDSRSVIPGGIFVALKGERVDGHSFVPEVLEKGAGGALVANTWLEENPDIPGKFPGACFLGVRDTLIALGDLAAYRCARDLSKVKRIGITGSNGKTTTKEMLKALLASTGKKVFASRGNFNSDVGLPLMVMETPTDSDFAIYEMGMNRVGEMDLLVRGCRPQVGLITNIGRAHIGILGSQFQIALEKRKVFEYADFALVPTMDPYASFLVSGFYGTVLEFGDAQVSGLEDLGLDGWKFRLSGQDYTLSLPGRHNLTNALGALAAALALGADPGAASRALASVRPSFGRSEILKGPITVIQDCYNANLDSMSGLIEFFKALEWTGGKKYLVLGAMRELGVQTEEHHRQLGLLAAESGADGIWFFGQDAQEGAKACVQAGGRAQWTDSLDILKAQVLGEIKPGDLVGVKGSRGVALERLVESISKEG